MYLITSVRACLCVLAATAALVAANPVDQAGFQSSVQPFMAKACYGCHNAKLASGGLDLHLYGTTEAVAKDRQRWELILDKLRSGQMPPPGMPRPPQAGLNAATAWISTELDREDSLIQPDPGHTTARRLNRTEYNNSIRDLLGVNSNPAAEFPPDDSGYGFDDIGDVLSVSPSLMEKYVSAAEKVARAALCGAPKMQPTLVKLEPWYVDFDTTKGVKTDYDLTGLSLPSALHVMHRFPVEGDYELAGLLRGNRPIGSEPIQVAFWVDGKQVRTLPYSVPASGEVSGVRNEFRVHVPAGEHMLSASILKIYEGLPVSFKGPNPSKLPPPAPRRGRAGANAPSNDEASAGGGAAVGFFVSNLEIVGPYDQVTGASEASRKKIFVCGDQTPACAKKIVSHLAGQVYRRPATAREVTQLAGLVALAQQNGDSFQEGLCLAIERMLISPSFLFLIEQNRKNEQVPGPRPVGEYELASRLSYFLWGSTPDDELLRLAGERKLCKPEVLAAEVKRMLRDPKSQSLTDDFGGQWLQFRALESHEPDRKKFQQYTEYTRMSIAKETELFFANIVHEDRPITDFLNAKYTFLNDRLADFYGIPGVRGAEFRKVDLSGSNRQGVLTQASVLTVSSYANRTSPVIRGKWVLENILNSPPPPPPPDVPTLDEAAVGTTLSMREQLEKHRANAVCASCHSRMDPLGFSLENFDAIGQWRSKDGKFPIDATGQLPDGRKFEGAGGLADVLMSNPDAFSKALTEKMLTYALGRGIEPFDRPAVKKIVSDLAANQYRFSSLVMGVVNSFPFQESRSGGTKLESKLRAAK